MIKVPKVSYDQDYATFWQFIIAPSHRNMHNMSKIDLEKRQWKDFKSFFCHL